MSDLSLSGNKLSTLTEAYLPPMLPGRGDEIAELRRYLHPFTRHRPIRNIWLHGPPGSGKTSAAKLLLDEMEHKHGIKVVYINSWEAQTFHAVVDRAARDLRIFGAERSSAVFKMERLEKAMGNRRLLVVLDEFDIPSPRERDAIIYNLCGMPRVALLCISNSRQFYYSLDGRARSRLDAVLVEFKPYTARQINEILRYRAELIFGADLDGQTQDRIARLAHGDARTALQTLRSAAVAAEMVGAKRILAQHVRTGHDGAVEAKNRYLLAKLGDHHVLIYRIVEDRRQIQSGELWKEYVNRCRQLGVRPAASRTFSQYVKCLVEAHLIVRRRVLGARGNVWTFRVLR